MSRLRRWIVAMQTAYSLSGCYWSEKSAVSSTPRRAMTAILRICPHPQRLQIPCIHATFFHADVLHKLSESAGDRLLFRPRLQPVFHVARAPREFCELHDFVPVRGRENAHHRRGLAHLLIRPESPADVVLFQRLCELCDPLVGIFAGLSHPDRHVVTFA